MTEYHARVVCAGAAAELHIRTSGRRGALGAAVGRRRRERFRGASAILAHSAGLL